MRKLLISAGYRYPSAVPVFYGIKFATALLFAAMAAGIGIVNDADVSSIVARSASAASAPVSCCRISSSSR